MQSYAHAREATRFPTEGSCALTPQAYVTDASCATVAAAEVIPFVRKSSRKPSHEEPVRAGVGRPQDRASPLGIHLIPVALALALLLAALFASDALASQARSEALSGVTFEEVTVHAGDSLWSLACDHAVEGLTTAQVVDVIRQQNSLHGSLVQPGDTLAVPTVSGSCGF